ncbi:MAG: NfeD family protein [Pirellulaceae bacterium]
MPIRFTRIPRFFLTAIGMVLAISLFGWWPTEAYAQPAKGKIKPRPERFERPFIIEFRGPIHGAKLRYFRSRIETARRGKADLIVVEFDSPGGQLEESYAIGEILRDLDWAFTVAYCERAALSGAALAAMGADELIMTPEARIGDIGVIYQDPAAFAFRFAPAKIISDVVAFGRGIAESKGRSPELVEAMIDKDVLVFSQKTAGGKLEFKTARVDDKDKPGEPWQLVPESGPERFLELSGPRAVELGLATATVKNQQELAGLLQFDLARSRVLRHKTSDTVAAILSHPIVAALLIIIGALALYIELSVPGIGAGGIIATLCAGLFFWSNFMGGTAGILEVLLFIGGVGLIVLELFVIPGWGVSGIAGFLMVLASAVLASQSFVIPQTTSEVTQFVNTLIMIFVALSLIVIGGVVITKKIGRIPFFNQIVLTPPVELGSTDPKKGNSTGPKPEPAAHPIVSVGDWGESVTVLRPAGRARFASRSVDVISDGEFIDPGTRIRVVRIQGAIVTVTRVTADGPKPAQS